MILILVILKILILICHHVLPRPGKDAGPLSEGLPTIIITMIITITINTIIITMIIISMYYYYY